MPKPVSKAEMHKTESLTQSTGETDEHKGETRLRTADGTDRHEAETRPRTTGEPHVLETMAWFKQYKPAQRKIILKRARYLDEKMKKQPKCEYGAKPSVDPTSLPTMPTRARLWTGQPVDPTSLPMMPTRARIGTKQSVDPTFLPTLLACVRIWTESWLNAVKHALRRPLYYAQEAARRRDLAKERRSTRQRHTENPCPTPDQIIEAWQKKTESREAMLRFGSLIEDLACHVDSSLHIVGGRIVGRAPGVKGWLHDNLPALATCYSTVMRYKAAARRMRQIVDLKDPIPVEVLFDEPAEAPTTVATATTIDAPNKTSPAVDETPRQSEAVTQNGVPTHDEATAQTEAERQDVTVRPPRMVEIARAKAVFHEAMDNVPDRVTPTLKRIHELLDSKRVADATMLKSWRDHYACTITEATWKTALKHTIADGIESIERLTS